MGNILPLPCLCYDANDEEAATTAGAKRRRSRKKKKKTTAFRVAARHVVPVDTPEQLGNDGEEEGIKQAALPGGCRLEPVGGDDGAVRVKIVMKRKEVEELVARLEQRDTAERKAKMEELGGGGAVTMMSPCRDAWRPRLASIPEN